MASFLAEAKYKGSEFHPVFHPGTKYDIRVQIGGFTGRVRLCRVIGYENKIDVESFTKYASFKSFLNDWQLIRGLGEYDRRLGK